MKNKNLKDWLFVLFQGLFFVLYVLDLSFVEWKITSDLKILMQLITAMGVLISILAVLSMNTLVSPFPSPKKQMQLQTKGIYAFARHPIYSGIIIAFYAWGIAHASEYKILIALMFHLFIYFKARYEEKLLRKKFENYKTYHQKTGMFFPKLLKL